MPDIELFLTHAQGATQGKCGLLEVVLLARDVRDAEVHVMHLAACVGQRRLDGASKTVGAQRLLTVDMRRLVAKSYSGTGKFSGLPVGCGYQ